MKSHFELVCEFNKAFDYKVYNLNLENPFDNVKDAKYRYDLIHEEGIEELGLAIRTNNRIETMDAIADLLYVLYGACYTYNLNPDNMFNTFYDNFNTFYDHTKLFVLESNIDSTQYYDLIVINIKLLKECLLVNKNIIDLYSILLKTIILTYQFGFCLKININKIFNIVHESNMSKLCLTEEEAQNTVNNYIVKRLLHNSHYEEYCNKYGKEAPETLDIYCPYDSPYYYFSNGYYLVKNKSTGKALKSINYKPVNI
jgi:predicted HAD superfamily Cof-like phosphohydrolase